MAPGKPRVQFRVMEGAETLGLRALRREFGLYGEALGCMDLDDISSYIIYMKTCLISSRRFHAILLI